jgi:hypothetical protein
MEQTSFKYRAFLSYSHRDTAWGRWLHQALEGYGIDKDLVGRETTAGSIPKALRPIFRDREDFAAGATRPSLPPTPTQNNIRRSSGSIRTTWENFRKRRPSRRCDRGPANSVTRAVWLFSTFR